MNWFGAASLDELWRSPTFPMWLTLAAAGFFGVIVLITVLRAEKSVVNGALTVITLLAIGIAGAAAIRGFGPDGAGAAGETQSLQSTRATRSASAALPALSCIDDLAGDTVLAACEKALFGSAESVAAAVSYAASQITRLTALGDASAANRSMTSEAQALRRAVERDRYGLMAYVLAARDHCTPSACAAFRSLTDYQQVAANMNERTYEGLVSRYAPLWNVPPAATGPVAALAPSTPTGKPTNAEFPSAASTPAVSIMTPEPGPAATPVAPRPPAAAPLPAASAPLPSPRPPAATAPALAAAKKQPAPKPARTAAPVQLAPAAPGPATAPAPSAANE
ncbi:hypothetical protein [Bradyrhizobium sp. URHD0069]|uniref:hypothetical protein n=1 Tax=Bradyrhizobium sp. URHD0069 TaxID=1380355 RepID=UPI000497FBAA|nr:hypothetical protein [Bradyrhizobium sp. URHD0069]